MFSVKEEASAIQFEISSKMRNVDRIIGEVDVFLEQLELKIISEFKIVIRELLINAIEHGNQNNPDRTVHCAVEQVEDVLFKVTVEDEGDGFDYKNLDMAIPEDPRQVRHRGYALIKSFTEKILFNEKGNQTTVYLRMSRETEFVTHEENNWQIITPSGDITATVANKFRILLHDLVQQGSARYRFDLKQVEDMDSVSLSVFIILSKMLSNDSNTPDLEIINVNSDLVNLFHMTGLDKTYRISPTA